MGVASLAANDQPEIETGEARRECLLRILDEGSVNGTMEENGWSKIETWVSGIASVRYRMFIVLYVHCLTLMNCRILLPVIYHSPVLILSQPKWNIEPRKGI